MKKLLVTTLAIGMTVGVATTALAVITGSGHDFTTSGWASGEICLPCHTPHNAYTFTAAGGGTNQLVPLWNHTQTATVAFDVYSSPTNTFDGGVLGQPAGVSRACLSCHDGTVALDSFGGAVGGTFVTANLGTDLSNDHPVSFLYATSDAADAEIQAEGSVTLPLPLGNVECNSCHDPHNTPGFAPLLQMSNAASALCLHCHIK